MSSSTAGEERKLLTQDMQSPSPTNNVPASASAFCLPLPSHHPTSTTRGVKSQSPSRSHPSRSTSRSTSHSHSSRSFSHSQSLQPPHNDSAGSLQPPHDGSAGSLTSTASSSGVRLPAPVPECRIDIPMISRPLSPPLESAAHSALIAHSTQFVQALRCRRPVLLVQFPARMQHLRELSALLEQSSFTWAQAMQVLFDHHVTVEGGFNEGFVNAYQTCIDRMLFTLRYDFVDLLMYHQAVSKEYQRQRLRAEEVFRCAKPLLEHVSLPWTPDRAQRERELQLLLRKLPSDEARCDFLWRSSILMLEDGQAVHTSDVTGYNDAVDKFTKLAYAFHANNTDSKFNLIDKHLRWHSHPTKDDEFLDVKSFELFKQVVCNMLLAIERYRHSVPGTDELLSRILEGTPHIDAISNYSKTVDIKKGVIDSRIHLHASGLRALLNDELNHWRNKVQGACGQSIWWLLAILLPLLVVSLAAFGLYHLGIRQ